MADDSIITSQSSGSRLKWSLVIKSLPILLLLVFIRPLTDRTGVTLRECAKRHYDDSESIVCVCNATYCDDYLPVGDLEKHHAAIYTTSKSGKRLSRSTAEFKDSELHSDDIQRLSINSNIRYQTVIGFGGAFTDAAGINIDSLSPEARRELLNSYFANSGIQYTLGRVPIASCDFSTHEYSYDDTPEDFELSNFSLANEDFKYKIPNIKQALELTDGELRLVGSPWSSPAWMKTSNRMVGPGELRSDHNGSYSVTWANYFVKFLEAYLKEGVKFWGLTVQNEPHTGIIPTFRWQTMYFNGTTQRFVVFDRNKKFRDFVKNYLGPALHASGVGKDIALMILDDQRDLLPQWTDEVLNDKEAAKYVSGIALHWYNNKWTPASVLNEAHEHHPDKFMLASEACVERVPQLGNWTRAELYAHDIIEDLSHWVAGWIDWNLCLDLDGGPNFVSNFVDSPIIVNATSDEFYKQPIFYAMGHFSKFIRPGSVRIESKLNSTTARAIEEVAFVVPSSNQRILVLLNQNNDTVSISIEDSLIVDKALNVDLEPYSLATIIWNV